MTQRDASVTPRQIIEDTAAMVRLADQTGFDVAWFAERACRSLERFVTLMERAFWMPFDQIHADRVPPLPGRVAAVA